MCKLTYPWYWAVRLEVFLVSYKVRPYLILLMKFLAEVLYYYRWKVFAHSSLFRARTFGQSNFQLKHVVYLCLY
jgi:hypothetical protein